MSQSLPFVAVYLISEDKHPMRIHSAIVVETSKPLNALIMNGIMKESASKVAVHADVNPEAFTVFCEYAYTGTYISPFVPPGEDDKKPTLSWVLKETKACLPSIIYQNHQAIVDKDLDLIFERYKTATAKMFNLCMTLCGKLLTEVEALKYGAGPIPTHGRPCTPFHAKLYVFATKYLAERLRQKFLRSTHQDLTSYLLKTDELCDLLEYFYRETGSVEPGGRSSLRSMLILYVAARLWRYSAHKRFLDMLQSNGEIGADLIQKLTV